MGVKIAWVNLHYGGDHLLDSIVSCLILWASISDSKIVIDVFDTLKGHKKGI